MLLFTATSGPFALSRWSAFFANFNQFLKGFFYTLEMSVFALLLSLILGVIFGAMSSSKTKLLKGIARVYVEIFQNTPLLVQFVFVYYGLAIMTNGAVMQYFVLVFTTVLTLQKSFALVLKLCLEDKPKQLFLKDLPIKRP